MRIDLNDLIEFPQETPENEYKTWMNLNDTLVRAKIASHLAALANNGGGYIIFGFKDNNLIPDEKNRPPSLDNYNQDTFTNITKRYLEPAFQCNVELVANKEGRKFPVVRVPGHKSSPVIAKANGPQNEKGKVQGILEGTYYIRKPGPESAPIKTSQEWNEVIRRCVLNDRGNLLNDISSLIHDAQKDVTSTEDTSTKQQPLEIWHKESKDRFLDLLPETKIPWPTPLDKNYYQLSYMISLEGEEIPLNSLRRTLVDVHNEVRNTIRNNWSMFYQSSVPEIAPTFSSEQSDGTGVDVLESNFLVDLGGGLMLPEFWRVAPNGYASLVRAYLEDNNPGYKLGKKLEGPWLSPVTIIRETAEFITHAMLLARRFEMPKQVTFRCTWVGLKNREIGEFKNPAFWRSVHMAKTDKRDIEKTYTIAELEARWSTIVSDLACPILLLFGFDQCGADFIESMKPEFT